MISHMTIDRAYDWVASTRLHGSVSIRVWIRGDPADTRSEDWTLQNMTIDYSRVLGIKRVTNYELPQGYDKRSYELSYKSPALELWDVVDASQLDATIGRWADVHGIRADEITITICPLTHEERG